MFLSYASCTPHVDCVTRQLHYKCKSLFFYLENCSQVSVANAKVLVGNEGHLVIKCNEGYNLIGSNAIRCLPNGLLNKTLPSCGRGRVSQCWSLSHAWLRKPPLEGKELNREFKKQFSCFFWQFKLIKDGPYIWIQEGKLPRNLNDRSVDRLIDWLIDWLIDLVIAWVNYLQDMYTSTLKNRVEKRRKINQCKLIAKRQL